MTNFRTPRGVKDYIPSECYAKNSLENTISAILKASGFCHVETGNLEYFDLYTNENGVDANKMFKLTDTDGALLVLRPDVTRQIVRLASSKLGGGLQKLYYIANSFEFLPDTLGQSSRSREFAQIGVEILNANCVASDTEALILAIESLKSSGLDDFIIELGHIDFLNGILDDAKLDSNAEVELKKYLNSKDALGLEMFVSNQKLSSGTITALKEVSSLYGGLEILAKAKLITKSELALKAIENLEKLTAQLKLAGYAKYIRIDLALLKGGYYSGVVFKGLASSCGSAILDGGRYTLGGADGVGFCIGVQRLLESLSNLNATIKKLPIDIAFINKDGFSSVEFDYIKRLRSEGFSVIKLFCTDENSLKNYCKQNDIKRAIVFSGKDVKEVQL